VTTRPRLDIMFSIRKLSEGERFQTKEEEGGKVRTYKLVSYQPLQIALIGEGEQRVVDEVVGDYFFEGSEAQLLKPTHLHKASPYRQM
jgi:hypothetical protein